MSQYTAGVLRLEAASSIARASWKATIPAGSDQQFAADEVLNFSGSGATGRFLSLDPVSREIRFFRTSAALPANGNTATGATSGEAVTITAPTSEADFVTAFAVSTPVANLPLLIDSVTQAVFQQCVVDPANADWLTLAVNDVTTAWADSLRAGVRYAIARDLSYRLMAILDTGATPARAPLILPNAGDILLPQLLRWNAMVLERSLNCIQTTYITTSNLSVAGKVSGRIYILDPSASAARSAFLQPVSSGTAEVGQVAHFKNRNTTHNLSVAPGVGVQIDDSGSSIVLAPGDAMSIVHLAADRWYTLTEHP